MYSSVNFIYDVLSQATDSDRDSDRSDESNANNQQSNEVTSLLASQNIELQVFSTNDEQTPIEEGPQFYPTLEEMRHANIILQTANARATENVAYLWKNSRDYVYLQFLMHTSFFILCAIDIKFAIYSANATAEAALNYLKYVCGRQEKKLEIKQQELTHLQNEFQTVEPEWNKLVAQKTLINTDWSNPPDDNCVSWLNDNGVRTNLTAIFPKMPSPTAWCYLDSGNRHHPLSACDQLAKSGCEVEENIKALWEKKWFLIEQLKQEKADVGHAVDNINSTKQAIADFTPSFGFYPMVAITGAVVFIFSGLFYNTPSLIQSFKDYQAQKINIHSLDVAILHPEERERVKTLLQRLNILSENKLIPDLIKELEKRITLARQSNFSGIQQHSYFAPEHVVNSTSPLNEVIENDETHSFRVVN